jgi:hypothetical protein
MTEEKLIYRAREPVPPHEIILPKMNGEHLWEMQQWCLAQFGVQWNAISREPEERSGRWTMLWCGPDNSKCYRWHFRTEQDVVLFALRWA